MDWDELGNRLAMFGDNDSVRIHSVEQRQALFLKFSGWDCFHGRTILQEPQLFQSEKLDIIMMGKIWNYVGGNMKREVVLQAMHIVYEKVGRFEDIRPTIRDT